MGLGDSRPALMGHLLVVGMILTVLYVVLVHATYLVKPFNEFMDEFAHSLEKHSAAKGYYGSSFAWYLGHFLRLGLPTGVFTLLGLLYLHHFKVDPGQGKGRARDCLSLFMSDIWTRLGRPQLFWYGRWFSLGELLFILLTVLLTLVNLVTYLQFVSTEYADYFLAEHSRTEMWIELFALGFGLSGLCSFFFLLFPVSRGAFWMKLLGLSFDRCIKYHRWLSRIAISCFNIHGLLYFILWWIEGEWVENAVPCKAEQVSDSFIQEYLIAAAGAQAAAAANGTPLALPELPCDPNILWSQAMMRWQNFMGLIAGILFTFIWLTSLEVVRRRYFELFYYSHFLFIVAFYASILHFQTILMFIYPAAFLYIIFRVRTGVTMAINAEVQEVQWYPESELFALRIARSPEMEHQFYPGQYVFLCVPAISEVQSHPFSISSAPSDDPHSFTVHAKVLGTWTANMALLIQSCLTGEESSSSSSGATAASEQRGISSRPMPMVKVDGYYGARVSYHLQERVVLLTGGIGVTPALSILKECYQQHLRRPTAHRMVEFHWVVREEAVIYPFMSLLEDIVTTAGQAFQVHVYVTRPKDSTVGATSTPDRSREDAERSSSVVLDVMGTSHRRADAESKKRGDLEGSRPGVLSQVELVKRNKLALQTSARSRRAFTPLHLGCWHEVALHVLVWAAAMLSVLLLWYFTGAANTTDRKEKYEKLGLDPENHEQFELILLPDRIPWYVVRIAEPTLFIGVGGLLTFLIINRWDTLQYLNCRCLCRGSPTLGRDKVRSTIEEVDKLSPAVALAEEGDYCSPVTAMSKQRAAAAAATTTILQTADNNGSNRHHRVDIEMVNTGPPGGGDRGRDGEVDNRFPIYRGRRPVVKEILDAAVVRQHERLQEAEEIAGGSSKKGGADAPLHLFVAGPHTLQDAVRGYLKGLQDPAAVMAHFDEFQF